MRELIFLAVGTGFSLGGPSISYAAESRVGELRCDVAATVGELLGSRRNVDCTFLPTGKGSKQRYVGSIADVGVDVGELKKGSMVWLVYSASPTNDAGLEGSYGGVTAEASVGFGLGANVLVGGNGNSISLQPVSLEALQGLNVAAGVTELSLRKAP